jgi:DNA replication protein DnaC
MYGNRYELFNEILFARYARHQPTIITTNLNSEGISERYGDRIFSRIVEMFDKLILNAEDLRMRK